MYGEHFIFATQKSCDVKFLTLLEKFDFAMNRSVSYTDLNSVRSTHSMKCIYFLNRATAHLQICLRVVNGVFAKTKLLLILIELRFETGFEPGLIYSRQKWSQNAISLHWR